MSVYIVTQNVPDKSRLGECIATISTIRQKWLYSIILSFSVLTVHWAYAEKCWEHGADRGEGGGTDHNFKVLQHNLYAICIQQNFNQLFSVNYVTYPHFGGLKYFPPPLPWETCHWCPVQVLLPCTVRSWTTSGDDIGQSLSLFPVPAVTSCCRLRPVISFISSNQRFLGRPLPLHLLPIPSIIDFSRPSLRRTWLK